ncbi:hypothetical protein B0H11DRAFT_1936818 [Mycena galericulata]|nr:hypothetical protein B0H11DRAFT_1936818 [Mycena galericulata]
MTLKALLPSPPPVQWMATLPTEVWTLILYAYCGGFDVHPYYYNHRRELLRQLNSEWKRLIDADGLFWCRVVVNASISVNSLQSHVECIRGRRMDVSIDLNHLLAYSTNSQCGADHPRYKHTRRLLSTLAPTSHLWRHVTVSSACVTFMRLILDVIRPLQAPSLEHLTFRAVQHGSMETMHDLFTTPPVIFNNNTPRLLHLRLVSATISWTSANIYSSLTVLEIINVARVRWPSEPEMVGMLASARSLVALVIKNCGVRHLRYGAQSRSFYIPQLVTLDLHKSNGMTSVIRALRHALTPALRCVTLRGFDGAHLRLLQTNLQGFGRIQQLRIKRNRLPEIFLLDIDCDAGQFVAVLADNPQYGTKLTSLAVADVNLALIHAYVMCRSNEKNSVLRLYLNAADEQRTAFAQPRRTIWAPNRCTLGLTSSDALLQAEQTIPLVEAPYKAKNARSFLTSGRFDAINSHT